MAAEGPVPCWLTVATVHSPSDCDSPKAETALELLDSARNGSFLAARFLFRDQPADARTSPEEPVNPASPGFASARICIRLGEGPNPPAGPGLCPVAWAYLLDHQSRLFASLTTVFVLSMNWVEPSKWRGFDHEFLPTASSPFRTVFRKRTNALAPVPATLFPPLLLKLFTALRTTKNGLVNNSGRGEGEESRDGNCFAPRHTPVPSPRLRSCPQELRTRQHNTRPGPARRRLP